MILSYFYLERSNLDGQTVVFVVFFITGRNLCSIYLSQSAITCSNLTIKNTITRCEICSKLTMKTRTTSMTVVFIVNFERISHLVSVFLFLALSR